MTQLTFKRSDLERAIKCAQALGLPVSGFEIAQYKERQKREAERAELERAHFQKVKAGWIAAGVIPDPDAPPTPKRPWYAFWA